MTLMLGDPAPNFTADTTQGWINFHDWLGDSWGILFSHPADFTPVCTTEFAAMARLQPKFEMRSVKVIGLSTDDLQSHHEWVKDIERTLNVRITFPIIADPDRIIADLYRMSYTVVFEGERGSQAVRSVFMIGPDKRVKLILTYPDSTGRNFKEILRVVDSLQLTERCGVATPADWNSGEDCLIPPDVSTDEAARRFPAGCVEIRPYLRYTPQPNPRAITSMPRDLIGGRTR
ncbi:MAG: peroxiredoxin [Phycisphaerales bacterium]|nr:MAG: peroxiredoxin [Phycisphaerales bacterium]